jgi:hypothetical protein
MRAGDSGCGHKVVERKDWDSAATNRRQQRPPYFYRILSADQTEPPFAKLAKRCCISRTNQTKKLRRDPSLRGAADSSSIRPFCPVQIQGGAS